MRRNQDIGQLTRGEVAAIAAAATITIAAAIAWVWSWSAIAGC